MEHKKPTEHLSMRLDGEVAEKLNRALAKMRKRASKYHGRVTKTSVIEAAIDAYLDAAGYR